MRLITFSRTAGAKDKKPRKKKGSYQRLENGRVKYRDKIFPGFNKPVASTRPGKKKMVLAKQGDQVKLVHYGAEGYSDFAHHKDKKRRARFQKRHRAIKLKDGSPAHKSKLQASYWSTKPSGGTW